MTLSPRLARASHLCLACLWMLPLWSVMSIRSLPAVYPALIVALLVIAAWRPAAGLLLFVLVLPLGFALVDLAALPMSAPRAVEGALLGFLAGAGLHAVVRRGERPPARLAVPAFSLGLVLAAGALMTAFAQFGAVGEASQEIWRYLTHDYLSGAGRLRGLTAPFRWMEVVALAAVAERTIRSAPAWSPRILALWIGAGAATAAQTVVWVARAALSKKEGLSGALTVLQNARVSAVYPDVNAAGSLFALLVVTAILFGVARRRWLFVIAVTPVLLVAMLATQSRAAVAAVVLVLGAGLVVKLVRPGRRVLGAGILLMVFAAAAAVGMARGPAQVSPQAALSSRVEMWRVALKIAREDPLFGAGAGRFQTASRDYVSPALVASFPEAAAGENAHNIFLQVLGELGLTGLIAFTWMLWAGLGRGAWQSGVEYRALASGLAAFLISALFGHPLLIFEIAAAFFLALGLAAGLAPEPTRPVRARQFALAVVVLVSVPWRTAVALVPDTPDVVGAHAAPEQLDGQAFQIAEPVSRWRLRAHARAALFPCGGTRRPVRIAACRLSSTVAVWMKWR